MHTASGPLGSEPVSSPPGSSDPVHANDRTVRGSPTSELGQKSRGSVALQGQEKVARSRSIYVEPVLLATGTSGAGFLVPQRRPALHQAVDEEDPRPSGAEIR